MPRYRPLATSGDIRGTGRKTELKPKEDVRQAEEGDRDGWWFLTRRAVCAKAWEREGRSGPANSVTGPRQWWKVNVLNRKRF